jgi:hypothetical protein
VTEDLGGEPMAVMGVGWRRHAISLTHLHGCRQA